jgi:Protein of unknown function DUF86
LPFKEARLPLQDILDAIGQINDFIDGMELDAFQADAKTIAAVERKLPVISEAAIRLGEEAEIFAQVCPGETSVGSAIGCGINTMRLISKRSGRRSLMTCRLCRWPSSKPWQRRPAKNNCVHSTVPRNTHWQGCERRRSSICICATDFPAAVLHVTR